MWSDSDFESPPAPLLRKKLDNILQSVENKEVKCDKRKCEVTYLEGKKGIKKARVKAREAGGTDGNSKLCVDRSTDNVENTGGVPRIRNAAKVSVLSNNIGSERVGGGSGGSRAIGGGYVNNVNIASRSETVVCPQNVQCGVGGVTRDAGTQCGYSIGSYDRDEKCLDAENINLKVLLTKILISKEATIEWLMSVGILKKKRFCPTCGEEMKLVSVPKEKTSDLFRWRCQRKIPKKHDIKLSLRHGSWYSKANMTLEEMTQVTYLWCLGLTQTQIKSETGCSSNTLVDWSNFCREVCEESLLRDVENGQQIGGDNVIVEIDESKFAKRKYNRGHEVKGGWVFGGREKEDKSKTFMVVVPDRTRDTLIPIIQKYIARGSIIRSDCWKAYDCLSQLGYKHETVNHSYNFKDPDTGCHTNGIEGDWQKAKRSITMPRFGVKGKHLQGYLSVHTWRQKNNGKNLFVEFMKEAGKIFDGYCNDNDCRICHGGDHGGN